MNREPTPPPEATVARRPSWRGRWIASVGGAIVLGFSVLLAATVGVDPNNRGGQALGKPVPMFDLPTVDGDRVSSRGLMGKAYIVNFWNSWCVPCRQEHPALEEFYRRHAGEADFAMVGIVRDDSEDAVRRYVNQIGMRWTVAFDPHGQASLGFATFGQPETYAISPTGVVVGAKIGPSTIQALEAMLARAHH